MVFVPYFVWCEALLQELVQYLTVNHGHVMEWLTFNYDLLRVIMYLQDI